MAHALIFGSSISMAIGGVATVLGFWALGVPSPVLWGALTGIFSMAPGFGSAFIWVPLAAFLAITGKAWTALLVVLFCLVVLVVINDNLLRPLIVGSRLTLHPFLILLSLFGGAELYGVPGLVVGPMIVALAQTILNIYHRDYAQKRAWE